MGQYLDSKGRRLGDLINSSWITDDLSDVQANTGVTLSELAELAATTQSELYASNTAIRSYVDTEIAALVDSAPEALDTLNELAAALGDDANFATTLTNNLAQKLGATASVSITGDMVGSGSFSANAVTISVVDQNLANTNAYIASVASDLDTQEAKQASDLANTNAYVASVDAQRGSDLANTNAYIASVASDLDTQEAKQASDLANTNAYIASVASDLDTQEAKQASDLANTNAYIASTIGDVDTLRSELYSTNTAIRSYVDSEVASLVDSAPETLDTLNELAASLGDDPNFATTLTTNLGQKLGASASVTLTGDVTGTANFSANAVSVVTDISDSGVDAGTYGSSSVIPVVTVGADGRITGISNTAVAGVTGATYEASNNTITITTADGGSFNATITDLKEISEAASELANTNARVAVVEANVAEKLGATASVALTGDATASGSFSANAISLAVTLSNSGVTAGQYGSGSAVPVVTVDAKGRVTDISTTAVAGVTGFDYTGANNTFTITTADGGDFTATIDDLQEVSDALANLANTNAYIASIASDLDTQEAKQASNLANTNARVAVVEGNITTLDAKVDSNLANTNAYVASVASALDTQEAKQASDLANTNAYISSTVGDLDTLRSELYSTNTAIRSYVDQEVASLVDSAPEALDTLNELAAALGDDANFATTLSTNLGQKLGASATVTLTGDATGSASFSSNAVSIAVTVAELDNKTDEADSLARLANTNAYIASVAGDLDTQEAKQASDLANTNAYIATVEGDLNTQEAKQASDLANTNAYIATVDGKVDTAIADLDTQEAKQASDLANTNAYIATVDGKVDAQVAKQASDLANTNAYIATIESELDTQVAKQASDLANTNLAIADIDSDIVQIFADIQSTNTAIRSYVDTEVAALVDSAPAALDTLNELAAALGDDENFATTISTNLGQKLGATATVTLSGDVTGSASFSANAVTITTVDTNLGNTNAYIATVDGKVDDVVADLAANVVTINTLVTDLDAQEAKQASDLANTNAYVASVAGDLATQISAERSALANTNAQIITLDTKVDSNLANTNAKLINIEDNLLATNTAIRALIPEEIGFIEYVFTATEGQTAFSGTDDNGKTFSYTTDKLSVFLNGVMLVKGVDYVQTNSSTITLDDAAIADDVVTIQAHEVANYVSKQGDVAPVVKEGVNANDTVLDSFGTGDFRTVKYLVQATDDTNSEYESMEVMVLHNGSTVQMVEYATLQTSGSLVDLSADIFGGNVRLLGSPTDASVTVKAIRLAVSA